MKLNQLEYMYEVSRCGNMTAAAAKLFVTQPTLSQQIMSLEEELGVKLFIRLPRSVLLTPAGEEFLIYAKRILSDVQSLTEAMEDYSTLRRGRIRVGMLSTFGYLNIIDKLAIFKKENPQVDTLITVNESKNLLQLLMSHKLDVAFVVVTSTLPDMPTVALTRLFDSNMMLLLPKNHPLTAKAELSISDLREENMIMPAVSSSLYTPIFSLFTAQGIEPKVVCETSHPELFMQMVASGMGLSFASEKVVAASRHYAVEARPISPAVVQSIYFAVLKDTYGIPVIQRFSDYVIREYVL